MDGCRLLFGENPASLTWGGLFTWNSSMVRRLLGIAVPNSIENGLFQLAKVALSSITAMFGTVQIAANGRGPEYLSLAALVGSAMGPLLSLWWDSAWARGTWTPQITT